MLWIKIKSLAAEIHPIVMVFGGIASVLIAFFAYQIDIKVQANALKTAQVDRANAMAQSIFSDQHFRTLRTEAYKMEGQISARVQALTKELGESEALRPAIHQAQARIVGAATTQLTRDQLYLLFDHATRVRTCIRPVKPDADDMRREAICDRDTVYLMVGSTFFDLYTTFRPAIFCIEGFRYQKEHLGAFMQEYHQHVASQESILPDSFFTQPDAEVCAAFRERFVLAAMK